MLRMSKRVRYTSSLFSQFKKCCSGLRIFCGFFLAVVIVCILSACSNQNASSSATHDQSGWMAENGKIKVLSTIRMIDDLIAQIGQDRIDRLTLINGEIDPHSYEMVKGDDEKINFAQVIFYNGLGLEHGASLAHRLQKHTNAIALGDSIRKLYPEKILKRGGQADPHIWMDISLWQEAIDPIVETLVALSPQDAGFFRANAATLKERMMAEHKDIEQIIKAISSDRRYLVTSHDSFHYFARAYLNGQEDAEWQDRFIAPEGLAPEAQISPADIQIVIDYLIQHDVRVVFSESNMSRDALRKIVEASLENGLIVEIAHDHLHSDAMGAKGTESGTYLGMMRHNAKVMVDAWTKVK